MRVVATTVLAAVVAGGCQAPLPPEPAAENPLFRRPPPPAAELRAARLRPLPTRPAPDAAVVRKPVAPGERLTPPAGPPPSEPVVPTLTEADLIEQVRPHPDQGAWDADRREKFLAVRSKRAAGLTGSPAAKGFLETHADRMSPVMRAFCRRALAEMVRPDEARAILTDASAPLEKRFLYGEMFAMDTPEGDLVLWLGKHGGSVADRDALIRRYREVYGGAPDPAADPSGPDMRSDPTPTSAAGPDGR
jgi:hypothetical protein